MSSDKWPSHNAHPTGKAEYLSAPAEGLLIAAAAVAIIWTALNRLANPIPLDQPGTGLLLSTAVRVVYRVRLTPRSRRAS